MNVGEEQTNLPNVLRDVEVANVLKKIDVIVDNF